MTVYGRVFEKMYEGSMAGAGLNVFALWNYMLTKARRGIVEINPKLVAFTLGGEKNLASVTKQIEDALEYLQRPDPKSRSEAEDGKRILKEGQFQYRIVNWESYERIRQEAENREYNRNAQAKHRQKVKEKNSPTPTESPSPPTSKFQKPTLQDIISEGLSEIEAQKFIGYYESIGWLVGKKPMKSWKGAAAGWKARNGTYSQQEATPKKQTNAELLAAAQG